MSIVNEKVNVTAEELIQRAHDMIPMLRAKSAKVEADGMVCPETIEAFKQAGFFKITQPAKWGGYQMNLEVFNQVLMEIGAGCPSSAWVLGVIGVHNWEMGLLNEKAQQDIWGEDPEALISSSYSPFGTATKVDGGWILNGTWRSSSGIDHAQWTIVGAYVYNEDGSVKDQLGFYIPRSQFKIVDDWDVYGLKGTGSKSLVVENVFIPEYRCHSIIEQPWDDRDPLYLLHQTFVFFSCVSSAIIGFGQAAVDYYIEEMKTRQSYRKNESGNNSAKASPYIKDRLGNAVLKVRTARARLLQAVREATAYVERREPIPVEKLAMYTLDCAATGRDISEAVTLLLRAQSARGAWRNNPIQRLFRDAQVAASHGTQNSDDTAGALGALLLGDGFPPRLFNLKGFPPEN